jgi:malonyl CoA-acyl carrier protein transacylase
MYQYSNLVDVLQGQAKHKPNETAYLFLQNGESVSERLTYLELEQKAKVIAFFLQAQFSQGERALLLYPPGLEFIVAFFGCLYAGIIPVPAYPPKRNQKLSRLEVIVSDAQAKIALTTRSLHSDYQLSYNLESTSLQWIVTDELDITVVSNWQKPTINSDTIAFLQYTSGSTGKPKGVMVTHGNILHNEEIIRQAFGHSENTIVVGWLPFYHDMGLIGNVLQPLYLGRPCILMSPVAFLQKPLRWLQIISQYKATTSGGPNFAYDLCVNQITPEQLETLDLSSWEVAFNGAELVRAESLKRFANHFAPCGFRYEAFYPCYGMAETTLIVSGGVKTAPPVIQTIQRTALEQNQVIIVQDVQDNVQEIVGCGRAWLSETVVIVNPKTLTQCPEGEIGEIWVFGESVAQGYWNHPEQTEKTFNAYLNDTGKGPFLRTGDLGFIKDGELYPTGRLKDLIVILGRNHYPQDIEMTVEQSHPALRPGCGATFSIKNADIEKVVVVQEVERNYLRKLKSDEVIGAIRQAVSEQHDLQLHAIVLLKTASLPKTSSGKIQRHKCREKFLAGTLDIVADWSANPQDRTLYKNLEIEMEPLAEQTKPTNLLQTKLNATVNKQYLYYSLETIQNWLIAKIAKELQVTVDEIEIRQSFQYYGLSSLKAVSISGELQEWLGCELSPTLLYDYPNIEALAQYLAGSGTSPENISSTKQTISKNFNEPIAIIGIGCRFPKANNPQAFWQLLRGGIDAISEVPSTRWEGCAYYDPEPATSGKMNTRWGGFLDQIDQFDPQFFGMPPKEVETTDPQQRLLLEVTWEALENAGQSPELLAGSQTGVFIGISNNDYYRLQSNHITGTNAYSGTGNAFSIAANRLSYLLDLRGPSLAIDTACSSSLAAVHQACQSLRLEECQLAIAGGVNLILSPQVTIALSQSRMMASDGRCKTFDASADGYVRGEGCGVVVLKRLSDAVRDRDNIFAVIRGSAVNQDGRSNGLTAPNGFAQQAVIRQALTNARVAPAQINYVEAHGTGTSLGDPIEINALKHVLMQGRQASDPCWIGSVKTNIGHLEAAAGIAGLIKVVLSLHYNEIPPHLHLKKLNPHISLEGTPLSIPTELQKVTKNEEYKFAGVSSFGFGGTNAHVVLEKAPPPVEGLTEIDRPQHLVTLSAKNKKALREMAQRYEEYLLSNQNISLANLAFTANTGRSHFEHRLAIVSQSTIQLREQIGAFVAGKMPDGMITGKIHPGKRPKIAFLFTGQGSQYVNMGRELYETQPTFKESIDRCDEILRLYLEKPLLSILYPNDEQSSDIHETAYTQPALFALEYALFKLWESWGITPQIVMGHSLGEYVAACVAGVFSLQDALKLVSLRGHLIQTLPRDGGAMVVVYASKTKVEEAIQSYSRSVSIAAINGDKNIVVSGEYQIVKTIVKSLESEGIKTQFLNVSHAFHSPLMEPILGNFKQVAQEITYYPPQINLISNLTGKLATNEIATCDYWCHHIRQPVKFGSSLEFLTQKGYDFFIEIGPKPILLGMIRQCLPENAVILLPSLREGKSDWQQILESISNLYINGVSINWLKIDQYYTRNRIQLPTYPFQRQRYWFEIESSHPSIKDELYVLPDLLLTQKQNEASLSQPISVIQELKQVSDSQKQNYLIDYIRNAIGKISGLDCSQLNCDHSLNNLGLDSLMVYQLKNKIDKDLGVNLSYLDSSLTLASLSNLLIEELNFPYAATHDLSIGEKQVFSKATGSMLSVLNQLTDEEVDSMLVSLLSESVG